MSLTLYFAKLRSRKARAAILKASLQPPQVASFDSQLSTRRGARVALPQSPILRGLQWKLTQRTSKNEKESVSSEGKSVTYVLSHECYRCPDCALQTRTLNL